MTQAFGLSGADTAMPYHRVAAGDFWVEDTTSPYYNEPRNQRDGGFRWWLKDDSERLTDYPVQYATAVVINFNRAPDSKVVGRGAGIFLHVNGRGATAGCLSVTAYQMRTVLAYMKPGDKITIQ